MIDMLLLSSTRSQYSQLWQVSLLLIVTYKYVIPVQEVRAAFVWSSGHARPGPRGECSVLRAIPKKQKVYKHLFRHYDDIGFDSWLRCTDPQDFLYSVGWSLGEIDQMSQEYPPLLDQNVHSQLAPKIRFLVETMGGGTGTLTWSSDEEEATHKDYSYVNAEEECLPFEHENDNVRSHHSMRLSSFAKRSVPAWFFGCNLDRVVGPRHAYLAHHHLPHGSKLLHEYNGELFLEFLQSCKESKPQTSAISFLKLCTKWETRLTTMTKYDVLEQRHTQERLDAFEQLFGPGLLPATYNTRNDALATHTKSRCIIDPNKLIHLLATHGSNYLECDTQGMTPLHWAAATGKEWGVQCLLQRILALSSSSPSSSHVENNVVADFILGEVDAKNGATSFHWACCGIQPGRRIGSGGSFDICRIMLEYSGERQEEVANAPTFSKSTPLMWASWSSSSALDGGGGHSRSRSHSTFSSNDIAIVDLLVLHGADVYAKDTKGRSAIHWAAAAGNLKTCQYLYECGVDVYLQDEEGKTALDYAERFDRDDVVQWLTTVSTEVLDTNLDGDSRIVMKGAEIMNSKSM